MTHRPSISTRLTVGALLVLVPSAVALGAGGWWLMRRSLRGATDAHLAARIDSVSRYIESMERTPPEDGLEQELQEYVQLADGDVQLEVVDARNHRLCGPLIPNWNAGPVEASLGATPVGDVTFMDVTVRDKPFRLAGTRLRAGEDEFRIVSALPIAPNAEALRRFAVFVAAAMPIVVVVAGLGSYWISRGALAPVDRVTRSVRAITVRDLNRRLDVPPADDELTRLVVTFNEMLARVERAVAELVHFTAEAAHELRTPVTLLRTTAEVALSRERSADEYRAALTDVRAHSEQMSTLVGDLLDLARADAGAAPAESSIDLRDVAARAAHDIAPAMGARGLAFTTDLGGDVAPVRGDAESLRRLFVILLDNACKYSRENGPVGLSVRVDREAGRVSVEVVDAGIGIAPTDRSRVFDRFYRAASARVHAAEGSGLGLSIARLIVMRHGGTIEIDDGLGGVGCRVSVELPGTVA